MNVSRRRYMGGSQDSYIQDGLIFWLDGINKGNDATAWTDLIGGIKFPYVTRVTPQTDHINFASGQSVFKANSSDINWPYSSCTIEICSNGINGMLLYDQRNYMITLGVFQSSQVFLGNRNNKGNNYILTKNIKSTISISESNGYQNGISVEHVPATTYFGGGGSGITIGSRGNQIGYFYVGDIYSIRVYNRRLTQEEATQNYLVDKSRFNF